jgi:hypothetical protein
VCRKLRSKLTVRLFKYNSQIHFVEGLT